MFVDAPNRSTGWANAKERGHRNERDLSALLNGSTAEGAILRKRLGLAELSESACSARTGAEDQNMVPSVCLSPAKTKGKVDLDVWWVGELSTTHFSLKGSVKGQVDLRSLPLFLSGMKLQFGSSYNESVELGLGLFVGDPKVDLIALMKGKRFLGPRSKSGVSLEKSQGRLAPVTLRKYFSDNWDETLTWIDNNRDRIAEFVFSRGLARDPANHAEYVWYKTFSSTGQEFDRIYKVSDIVERCTSDETYVRRSNINSGTTLDLPFGFLQMHQKKLQFHHDLSKLSSLNVPYM
jgi:hypothetical protein